MSPASLVLAHTASDAAVAGALRALLRQRRPGLPVRLAAVPTGHPGSGWPAGSVVVPLGRGRTVLDPGPGAVVAPLHGPHGHRLLLAAAERRLREAGVWPGDPGCAVVLAAPGSDGEARDRAARTWRETGWGQVLAVDVEDPAALRAALARLRREGAQRMAVARLDVVGEPLPELGRGVVVAAPLGACDEVARVVLDRFDTVCAGPAGVAA